MSEVGQIHDLPPSRRVELSAAGRPAAERRAVTDPSQRADRAEFSDYAQLLAHLAELGEIRADKVAAVREQVEAGTYETAEKLDIAVRRALRDILE